MKKHITILVIALSILQANAQVNLDPAGVYVTEEGERYSGLFQTQHPNGNTEKQFDIVDGVIDGSFQRFDEAERLIESGHYIQGKKAGTWKQYHTNGIQSGEANYKDGLKDGIWTVWDEEGTKRYHMVYSSGRKVDVWKMYDEHGRLTNEMAMETEE
jgi:antitoxin component YwqK of YwqJK toxin-antitoxin module